MVFLWTLGCMYLNLKLPYDPAIPLLHIYPEKTITGKTHEPGLFSSSSPSPTLGRAFSTSPGHYFPLSVNLTPPRRPASLETNPMGRHKNPHFKNEDPEIPRGWAISLRLNLCERPSWGSSPDPPCPWAPGQAFPSSPPTLSRKDEDAATSRDNREPRSSSVTAHILQRQTTILV